MLCILYVIAVGTCLCVVGVLTERALPATSARRWVWCVIIPMSVFLPGFYRFHHTWSLIEAFDQQARSSHLVPALATASMAVLDPGRWAQMATYDTIINALWRAASALLIAWGLASVLRVSLLVYRARRRQADTHGPALVDGVPVVVTDSIGPATVGLLRSRVLVPQWVLALPQLQRRYVLCHENEHRRAHDARLLFVASLFLILMPWNLALWWQLRRLRLAIEMDCDNRVVHTLGDAHAYGELLFTVAQATSRGPRLQPALLGGVGMLERRLTALLAPMPLRHLQRFLVPALAVALLFAVLSMPHPVLGRGAHVHASAVASQR